MDPDPLAVGPDQMRIIGHQVVDWLVERAAGRRDEPVLVQRLPAEMATAIGSTPPDQGRHLPEILQELGSEVLQYRSRIDHARYLAYVPGEGTWLGALGDLIASTYNLDAGNWMESAGPSHLEQLVLQWFAEWIGYPADSRGVLVGGGSAANLTALACAREAMVGAMRDDLVVYVSDQAHSSLARAARVLGFRPQQVRVLPVDECYRMRVDALAAAIESDVAAGRRPLAVLAVGGATNTGAVDRLPAIADLCREHGVWMHVDAAYGGFAAVTQEGARILGGLDRADSVTLDPHKWFYQPIECGALLVRDGALLPEAFEIHPVYLQDTRAQDREVNFADHGLQLTRTSRAVKIWLSLQYHGKDAFVSAIESAMRLAAQAQRYVEHSPELELIAPATLGIVCFRRHPAGQDDEENLAALNRQLVAGLAASGRGLVSSTVLHGKYAVRACILNHGTRWGDVEELLGWFETQTVAEMPPQRQSVASPAPPAGKTADVSAGWPLSSGTLSDLLRSFPLFAGVQERWVAWVGTVGRRRHVAAGCEVVRQWAVDRDFYLLLAGTADVSGSGALLNTLRAGDFFGELAALDWGASFGYPRLATVGARTDLELLVLTDAELVELMAGCPQVDARIRAAAGERAQRI